MRLTRSIAVLVLAAGQTVHAQAGSSSAPAATLTLDEAIAIARRNNPTYLQTVNTRKTADAQVRSAYGALLPSSNASFSTRYQQQGTQVFNGLSFSGGSDAVQSAYNLGLNYQVNSGTFIGPRAALASRDAADANITSASEVLRGAVTTQYINVLQAQARALVTDTLVLTAQGQLDLAKAKVAVGAGTVLDTRTAEVALGQAQVAALTAHNSAAVEMLRLFQQLGVAQPANVQLTTQFPLTLPNFSLDSLLDLARRTNPAILALHSTEKASSLNVRVQQSAYTPTLFLQTGWSGNSYQYTNGGFPVAQAQNSLLQRQATCFQNDSIRTRIGLSSIAATCNGYAFTPGMAQQIRDQNNQFPFKFTRAPLSLSASVSLPVFDNFNREQRVEQAQIDRENARYNTRARSLQLSFEVTQAYLNLVTQKKTVDLQEQNANKAREQLAFAEERYRVGAATFLDVTTSRGTFEQAQIDRVNSIYDYHKAFAALESAVGRPLR